MTRGPTPQWAYGPKGSPKGPVERRDLGFMSTLYLNGKHIPTAITLLIRVKHDNLILRVLNGSTRGLLGRRT